MSCFMSFFVLMRLFFVKYFIFIIIYTFQIYWLDMASGYFLLATVID